MSFVSITAEEKKEMLNKIGVSSVEDLFEDIPEDVKLKGDLSLKEALSEMEVSDLINSLGDKNFTASSFSGAGIYNHYIPSVVDYLSSRSEFYTAYTPYQPEVSQGTLTAIFEFQTMMSRLTAMDVTNASMYDGATACAEAMLMAARTTRKNKFLISKALHPSYREVLKTYAWAADITLIEVNCVNGITDLKNLEEQLNDEIGAVIIQSPNFFGSIEQVETITKMIHSHKAKIIVTITEALSLALLKAPGEMGVDIVCGEAQSFGNAPGFGGPLLGFISAEKSFMRNMPGRLVGKSTDEDGDTAYVLTLQTREQHIRRERATSNICTNQGLCLLRSVIYLTYYGNKLRDLALYNHKIASYLRQNLIEKGFEILYDQPFFNEFIVKYKDADKLLSRLKDNGINGGVYLGDHVDECPHCILICATEMNSKEDIDKLVETIESLV